jgi:hypothetical protein
MNRRDFIRNSVIAGCICAAGMGTRHLLVNKDNNIREGLEFDKKFDGLDILNNIDIHVVEHCNLNCKYCCHMSSIADEEYVDVQQFEKDINQLAKVSEQRIRNIYLMGGEPLLHPRLEELCKITRAAFPLSIIEIYTNRILLPLMPDSFWQTLHDYNINIMQSIYPIKIKNADEIYKKGKKFGVLIKPSYEESKHPIEEFFVTDYVLAGNVDIKSRFEGCTTCLKAEWSAGQLYKGRLYQCQKQQGVQHFNKKFNKHIPLTDEDTLDIYKIKNYDDIMEYKYSSTKFCRFCGFGGVQKPWEQSNEHDIHEFSYDA